MSKSYVSYIAGFILVIAADYSCAQENASNPLAAVSNTDLRAQFLDLGDPYLNDYFVDGAFMATSKLKLKYELHYWDSNLSGSRQSGFQSIHLKPIYFPLQGTWGSWKYKLSIGLEWILEFDAPLAQGCPENTITVLIPLLQQFFSYNGNTVNMTAVRLIAIQPLPKGFWSKLDFIVPVDWENDVTPATAEVQLGRMFKPSLGTYIDLMAGIGEDKPYEWGFGLGVRFNY
jgi:hypothetical protein